MDKYNKQAVDFLHKYGLTLSIRESVPQEPPEWRKDKDGHGTQYWCKLTNKEGKHYGFYFWDSIKNKQDGKRPRAYDVLACLDTYSDGSTFQDFCNDFGYDTDSIRASQIFDAVQKQVAGLKNILSSEALDEINEIQ
jgi:hypothetical protein